MYSFKKGGKEEDFGSNGYVSYSNCAWGYKYMCISKLVKSYALNMCNFHIVIIPQ